MTTSQTEKGSKSQITNEYVASTDYKDGALMEPRGCNRWQSVANRIAAETAKQAKTVAVGCDGKEGVDGSSPSEGSYGNACKAVTSVAWRF